MYWQIEKYSGSVINLMNEDPRIYSKKLTKKQVEDFLGLKLRVARSYENPEIIASAMVLIGSNKMIDTRKQRGTLTKCYMVERDE
ncbi:MAG: hypothetical protein GYA36_21495 [Veillonellaceae bacterium]|nr:hypothetical protein [Veillonellaceae bacterium]